MAGVRIAVLGPLSVRRGGEELGVDALGGTKPKQVLEILIAARGRAVHKERLADMLWPDARPRRAVAVLENYVSILRQRLQPDRLPRGASVIVSEPGAYRLATSEIELDLDRFDALVARARALDAFSSRPLLEEALALVRGDALEDEPYADWASELRETYRARVRELTCEAAEAALAQADFSAAAERARRVLASDPLCERASRLLMVALYAQGWLEDALRTFERGRAQLEDELGVPPSRDTLVLREAILRQEPVADLVSWVTAGSGEQDAGRRPEPRRTSPARARPSRPMPTVTPARVRRSGPSAPVFGEEHETEELPMLGRREELAALTEALRSGLTGGCTLVLVEGLTGVGKSRLLQEAARHVAPSVPIGAARCSRLASEVCYVPLAAALRDALGAAHVHPPEIPGLEAIFPELTDATASPARTVAQQLEGLLALLRRQAPLVLVLDDLQWADPQTIVALHYLQQRGVDLPVVLLGAYRGEDVDPGHPLRHLDPAERIRLRPLTADELAPLAIPGLHALTGGYAAYLPAALRPGPDEQLTKAVLSRVHDAGQVAAGLLIACSTLPSSFTPEMAALLTGLDPLVAAEQLELLRARGLLRVDGDHFDFCSTLVREVLDRQVSPSRRRLLAERSQPVIDLLGVPAAVSPLRVERVG